jgi:hypothetical protein
MKKTLELSYLKIVSEAKLCTQSLMVLNCVGHWSRFVFTCFKYLLNPLESSPKSFGCRPADACHPEVTAVGIVHATVLCNRTSLYQVDGAWYVVVGAITDF